MVCKNDRRITGVWQTILSGTLIAGFVWSFRLFGQENDPADSKDPLATAYKALEGEKYQEALDALKDLGNDKTRQGNQAYRNHALYLEGVAHFLLKDYTQAGRSLGRLAPFDDPVIGSRTRYLLARVHHLEDERPEAMGHYEAVVATHEAQRESAAKALSQPESLQDKPDEKKRLEVIVKAPVPDHLIRAGYYLGVLYYEAGRFAEAEARFASLLDQRETRSLQGPALLYRGMSEVQLRQFDEAVKTLAPLTEKQSPHAAQALLWTGKALAGQADAEDDEANKQALAEAEKVLRRAAEVAKKSEPSEPIETGKSGEILLALADVLRRNDKAKEAAVTYDQVIAGRLLPAREEEIRQLHVIALNLAGAFAESNERCAEFEKSYPHSLLLPEVLFRRGENNLFLAAASTKPDERERLSGAASSTYQTVIERFPEFPGVDLARYSLAQIHYRKGDYEKAQEILEKIPTPDRTGELAVTSYLLADCLIRQTPSKADDALAAGKVQEQLNTAIQLLSDFASNQPDHAFVPEALLRLGLCQQRLAAILSAGEEQKNMLKAAQNTFDKILIDYPLCNVRPQAAFERARCLALAENPNEAIERLRRFTHEPLIKEPIAPLALLQLATLLRGQENRAIDAAKVLEVARRRLEKELQADPLRASWAPLLRLHHGAALYEANQFAQARGVFASLMKDYQNRPEAALFWGQCLREESIQAIDQANQLLGNPETKPALKQAAEEQHNKANKSLRAAVRFFEDQAEELAKKQPHLEIRARMLYQAIWGNRPFAESEVNEARAKMQEEAQRQREAAKKAAGGRQGPEASAPEIAKVPIQPTEKKVLALYRKLIEVYPDLPLALHARLELAELLDERGDAAAAIAILKEALDKEPPADLADRIRLRLGSCYQVVGDGKSALSHFAVLAGNSQSAFVAQGHARAADCLLSSEDWDGAVKHLVVFRDQEPFQNIGNVSDWALLRLSYALAHLKKTGESRQALDLLITRFSESPLKASAHYAAGSAWIKEKDYDKALVGFGLAAANAKGNLAGQAQVQQAICQIELKQFPEALQTLRSVLEKANDSDLNGFALLEAAYAAHLLDQPEQVKQCLQQVVGDYPASSWVEEAKKRLGDLEAGWPPPHESAASTRLLMIDNKERLPLDRLGDVVMDRVALDDPTVELGHAFTLSHLVPDRRVPAAWRPLAVPDPFENHNALTVTIGPERLLPPREDLLSTPLPKK